ncbi:hypothetical protein T439DRAFT_320823 [Meredithblackwellia eburnea MCA 4105]
MPHTGKPSIDLEGGASQPISRRPPALNTLRPRLGTLPTTIEAIQSPVSPSPPASFVANGLPSPALTPSLGASDHAPWGTSAPPPPPGKASQAADSPQRNHFSTLPPSPPPSGPPSPPREPAYEVKPPTTRSNTLPAMSNNAMLASTPPISPNIQQKPSVARANSTPSATPSPRLGSSTGSPSATSDGGSVTLLSVQDGESKVKRRPSLILTSAPPVDDANPGLGVAVNGEPLQIPLSPRLRRQYPTDPTTVPIPPSPMEEQFSTPLNSPTVSSPTTFLSPLLSSSLSSSSSPTLPIANPLKLSSSSSNGEVEAPPPSPRLNTLTEPIARLVRRASSSSLNAELPTAVSRSPSPSRGSSIASPTLSSFSPTLTLPGQKRATFAAQAREKEREKEKELEERSRKVKKEAKKAHNRMFSWAQRPEDVDSPDRLSFFTLPPKVKRRAVWALIIVISLFWLSKSGFRSKAPPPRQLVRRNFRTRVPGAGSSFIHPDVITRRPPPKKSWIGGPWRWLRNALVIDERPLPSNYRPGPIRRTRGDPSQKPEGGVKKRNLFVPSKPVAYQTGSALPPAPVHSDAPERDTLVLYRILGNDLPPRHSPGQTLRNLRFLLQHESDFSALHHIGPHPVHHSHAYGSGSKSNQMHSDGGGLRVDKYFVLNRIAEPEMVSAIIGLLRRYSVPDSRILIIPFEWEAYERRDFRWDGGVDKLLGWGIGPQDATAKARASLVTPAWEEPTPTAASERAPSDFGAQNVLDHDAGETTVDPRHLARESRRKAELLARLRALDFTFHEKNLYAMNNNGGRNFALNHGRSLPHARWILPLDGNSFFTPIAMHSIVQTLSIAGEGDKASRYVVIPMARLLSNEAVLSNNSIAFVPRHHGEHDGSSAAEDAAKFHRLEGAPETPEEPQIGFRYDSTESFQEAMRYGRRSKLELLWRLGAIPYARGLDRRTLPWEQSDREHITADSWGSIPGVEGTDMSAPYHQAHGDVLYAALNDPPRGALSFAKAGWVYRLFSGDPNQEQHSQEAIALRNVNRIKGIIAFLERLDERVARGVAGGCTADSALCGFHPSRYWSFDSDEVERLRQKFKSNVPEAVDRVEHYESMVYDVHRAVRQSFNNPHDLANSDATVAATNATLLAMAGYLTGNSSYSTLSADLISARFVRQVPMFYRVVDQREQLKRYQNGQGPPPVDISQFDGIGYAFPAPPNEDHEILSWSAAMGHHMSGAAMPKMPFDPLHFDPILLMDAVRLLSSASAPKSDFSLPDGRIAVKGIFTTQLSYLLFNPVATDYSADPPSAEAGAHFDAKVAALAAFLDDARLFVRVANRARLRLSPATRAEGLLHPAQEIREVHYRLVQGVASTRLLPYNLASDPIAQGMYHTLVGDRDSPFARLGL